jgi:hypothetical protein
VVLKRKNNKIHKAHHRSYDSVMRGLDSKRNVQPKIRSRGLYFYVVGVLIKKNGMAAEVCMGPQHTEQEAYAESQRHEWEGQPEIFTSKHSTMTEANREWRAARASRGQSLIDVIERTRHQGRDL